MGDAHAFHPLDRSIWNALTGPHAYLAEGDSLARRYPTDIAPFAAVREESPEAYSALATLIPADSRVALFTSEPITPPPALEVLARDTIDQMVATEPMPPIGPVDASILGEEDVNAMLELVALTHPGPFSRRTRLLGTFFGVRDGGRLVAMAGERMRIEGHSEVSGICVHPDYRGRSLAAELTKIVRREIERRGETAFLHVFSSNTAAIALYRKLGFIFRQRGHLAVLCHEGADVPVDPLGKGPRRHSGLPAA